MDGSSESGVNELQQLFRSAFDDALVGMMTATPEGRFIRANRAACELLGRTEAELQQLDVVELSHPDDRAESAANLARLRAGEISSFEADKRYLRGDGSPVWVRLGATAVRDEAGDVRYYISQIQDITVQRAAEAALRESEERFRRLVENASDLVLRYRLRPEPGYDYVSPSVQTLLGYAPEELYARPELALETIHPEDRQRLEEAYARDPEAPVVGRAIRRDGSTVWIERRQIAIRDEAGDIVALEAIVRDVTERVVQEQALQDRERRLRAVFEGALDAMLIVEDDRRYVDANPAAAALFGLPVESIVGRTIDELIGRAVDEGAWAAYLAEGSTAGELTITRPDGEERVIEFRATAHVQPGRHLSVLRDVTERHRAEESLRATQEMYRLVVENAADLVALLDGDGRFVYVSPSHRRTLGYDHEELVGRRAEDVVLPDDRAAVRESLQRDEPSGAVFRVRAKDGRIVHLEGRTTPIPDPGGTTRLTLATSRDVSERVRAEQLDERLRQAEKMEAVGQVAAGVAHDFNNLLTAINGYSDLALAAADDRTHDLIVEIRRAGERAAELTRQLLAFSRKQVLSPVTVDLNALVDEQRTMLQRLLGEDVRIEVRPAPGPAPVRADPTQLVQVLLNLAVNARDAMPSGGVLTIETAHGGRPAGLDDAVSGSYVTLRVHDTGSGIEPDVLDRLFEPFFTTKPVGAGTGLGLATVQGIVEQSGGAIDVQSELGRGTTFTVYLPRDDERAPAPADAPTRVAAPGGNALVVEDNELVRPLLVSYLEAMGYAVTATGSPRTALQLAEGTTFDLLVTDVVMPEMNGRLLAAALRTTNPDLPVLFISGYTADAMVERGALRASEIFLQKPFTAAQLSACIASVVGRPPGRPDD